MNYRHIYHAGNIGDVLKHLVLLLCLSHLLRKPSPFCVIDTHGGAGLYDLTSAEARKTGEWEGGIGRLIGLRDAPACLALYLDQVRGDVEAGQYPGSPLLSARMLRPADRLLAAELHPPAHATLSETLRAFPNARALHTDAYQCARAHLPPKERRGLVLVDPPFEKKDEFETLIRQMREWKKRWARGVYILWYPIKAHLAVRALMEAAKDLAIGRTWHADLLMHPREQAETFNGCGVLLFNAPYQVPEQVESVLPVLTRALNLHGAEAGWLVPDAGAEQAPA
jgi:23S rRNA (adenine2030-N6)-methyltransferase